MARAALGTEKLGFPTLGCVHTSPHIYRIVSCEAPLHYEDHPNYEYGPGVFPGIAGEARGRQVASAARDAGPGVEPGSTGDKQSVHHGVAIAPRGLKFGTDILLDASYQRAKYEVDGTWRRGRVVPRKSPRSHSRSLPAQVRPWSGVRRHGGYKQSAGRSTGAHGIFCHGVAIAPRDLKFGTDILLDASYRRAKYGVDAMRRRGRADPRMISGTEYGIHGIFCHGVAIAARGLKFGTDILLDASYRRAKYGVDAIRRRGRVDPRIISRTASRKCPKTGRRRGRGYAGGRI